MNDDKSLLQEIMDCYQGVCEPWKIRLAASSIVEKGVPVRLWQELMQLIMIKTIHFKHRPIEGYSEKSILRRKIRSYIIDFLRKEKRKAAFTQKISFFAEEPTYTIEILQLCGENPHETLCRAVRATVSRLSDFHQRICRLFMQGYSKNKAAEILNISWREMRKEIASIKASFLVMGIEEIIEWRSKNRPMGKLNKL